MTPPAGLLLLLSAAVACMIGICGGEEEDPCADANRVFCNPRHKSPVCAKRGEELRTFQSACFLLVEGCRQGWREWKTGSCPDQEATEKPADPCAEALYVKCSPNQDAPVCAKKGQDLRTFKNSCYLLVDGCRQGWREWKKGTCSEALCVPEDWKPAEVLCIKPKCTLKKEPVCGKLNDDFTTYTNHCQLIGLGCDEGWRFWKNGTCVD